MTSRFTQFHRLAVLLVLFVPAALGWAKDAAPVHYVAPSEIDFTKILPAIASLTDEQAKVEKDFELSKVVEIEQEASPADIQRARDEAHNPPSHWPSPYSFSDVVGPWFKADNANISLAAALIQNVLDDTETVVKLAKKHWNRARPFRQDPADVKLQITDPNDVPGLASASYPSGHATDGMIFALMLSDLAPQLKDKLIARGIQYGDDRVILGVHFPSDVAAGRVLAQAIYAALKEKKAYQDDLAAAKAQFQKELAAHAGH